ncbi:hypothetical protein DKX38_025441 [Salix brachista]|uniref:MalT-like TPR region domain-containing protein n=1 Tax=Salix brachista TaxID=2182728 RepID=A0A5N5JPQ4_9ROSI|nr:hypothetical protein DKX38_025441 [Salix brachista]
MDVLNGDEYRRVDDDDTIGDFNSIDHLYHNVCEMQSSDPSPSRASFLSSGEESRIDSELCHLAGDTAEMEITKEVTISENLQTLRRTFFLMGSESGASARLTPKSTSHKNPPNDGQTLDKKMRKPKAVFAWKKRGRLTRDMVSSGENSQKAPELALRATKSFEIPVMEDGQNHALAKISGCMQLGDTSAMLGQIENSILCYTAGLEIQRQVLGEIDPQVGETCRYVAEAHVHALQFDEAENLCQIALDINREKGGPAATLEEAEDRRLMGFICDAKGNYESALEHYVLASMAMAGNYEQKMFDEARSILEKKYGPPHPDCTGQVRTLLDDAIEILDCVVGLREKKLGAANPDVDDEKQWLVELLKEAGRVRNPYH